MLDNIIFDFYLKIFGNPVIFKSFLLNDFLNYLKLTRIKKIAVLYILDLNKSFRCNTIFFDLLTFLNYPKTPGFF